MQSERERTINVTTWLVFQNQVTYMVQLVSKFTACIEQHVYLARFFAMHEELLALDTRVSRLLAHATMLASYATRDLYVLSRIPTRVILPLHTNLLASCFTQ